MVTWQGSSNEIFARQFDASGTPAGTEFQVNTETYSTQYQATVTGLSGGGYVVTWSSYNSTTYTYDIRAQRYDASGTAQGGEFTVNTTTANTQEDSAIASLNDGGFVVVWSDRSGADGDGYGVYMQRYNAAGVAQGAETLVNTTTTSGQYESDVVALSGGGFVVVWRDDNGDGNGSRIAAQVFDATGAAVGSEIQVNVSILSTQSVPSVTATPDGGFFVAWYSNTTNENYTYDIVGRHFDATGTAISGDVTISNDGAAYYPQAPDVIALPNGLIIAAWDYPAAQGDGNGRGVVQRLFELPGSNITLPVAPILEAVDPQITFTESAVQSGPQLIDASGAAAVSGPADFDGGRLIVTRITAEGDVTEFNKVKGQDDDVLGIRDQGTGVGQIGISGSDVTYGGTVIGTIVSDGGPNTNLEVQFNANATAAAVEALVENLTYANPSDDPVGSLKLAILLEDGDGGSADPVVVDIFVTPETDAPQPVDETDTQVNAYYTSTQDQPTVAALSDGGWIVMWRSYGQDSAANNTYGVIGQRFDSSGAPVGPEFVINTQTSGNQDTPDVAAITGGALAGGWVATWYDQANSTEGYVRAQLFDASGAKVGGEIAVPSSTYSTQYQPSVTTFADGSFAIAWSYYNNTTFSHDIYVQRFDASGAKVGAEIVANSFTASGQYAPEIVTLAGGGFAVTWESYRQGETDSYEISTRVFDAAGVPVSAEIVVNTATGGDQQDAHITALTGGGFVVTWTDEAGLDSSGNGVYAQIFAADGTAVGTQFLVNEGTYSEQNQPTITALQTGGFAIAYRSYPSDNSTYNILIQHYDAAGNRIDSEIVVNQSSAGYQYSPDIATLANGDVIVVWEDTSGNDGDGSGIFQQIVGDPANYASAVNDPKLTVALTDVTFDEADVNAAPALLMPDADVGDADSADFEGGTLSIQRIDLALDEDLFNAPDNSAQDNLGIRNQGTAAGEIGVSGSNVTFGGTVIGTIASTGADGSDLVVTLNANATPDAVEALLQNVTYANVSDDPEPVRNYRVVLTDGDGGTSQPVTINVTVTPEVDGVVANGDEQQVNSLEESTQNLPAIATLASGGYVVVWQTYDKDAGSNDYAVAAQLFDQTGTPVGDEFLVNTLTPGGQTQPAVASIATGDGGGFVVVWHDGSNNAGYVKAQVFNDDGSPRGTEFMVETEVYSTQYEPAVTQVPGGFLVTWSSYNNESYTYDIRGQRFDGNGTSVGSEFTVNTTLVSSQVASDVASDAAGNTVVVWVDQGGADGSGHGIFGQVFDAAGSAVGTEFQVNTYTESTQYEPSVAYLTDGRFVVTWTNQVAVDGSSYGVFAQIYAADGTAIGGEFLVNDLTSSTQYEPDVIGLLDGGFAIAYRSDGGQDGSGSGVFVQQFNADGSRRDGALQLNEEVSSTQEQPVITALQNGLNTGFAAAWTSYTSGTAGDGSGDGIFTRVFGPEGGMVPANASPDLDNVAQVVDFEVATIGTPALIDNSFDLTDADSADFNGGSVALRYVDWHAGASDQLSIIAGKGITVSGTDVLYDGTVIGTVDATDNGVNGADLVIALNANATAANVRYLLEQLGYASTAPVAGSDRSISIRVTDGDGGQSEGRGIRIDIETSVSLPTIDLNEVDNATYTEAQVEAGQRLDMSVDFDYTGTDGFDGGTVTLAYRYGITSSNRSGPAYEMLSVANIGTGVNQVSLSGGTVSYEGTAIGTVDATADGLQGRDLTITLNAAATEEAVDALIEAFTYTNSSQAPAALVQFRLTVIDSVGASTGNTYFDIAITPEDDGGPDALGDEEQVNAFVTGDQEYSSIAALADGGFVVTWESYNQDSTDGNDEGVYQQRYDAEGTPVGPETLVNQTTSGYEDQPAVAGLSSGGWVTVWEGTDDSGVGIFAAITDANGTVGPEFQVNFQTSSTQDAPKVAALSNGNFVVVWDSNTSGGAGDGSGEGVIGRLFDASGTPLSAGDIVLNTFTDSTQRYVDVTSHGAGGFVAVWASYLVDADSYGIAGQRFDASGNPVGSEFVVNTTTAGSQDLARVTELDDGGFVVVWLGPDNYGTGVYLQRYDVNGAAVGGEVLVNDDNGYYYTYEPDIAATPDGGWVVTWRTSSGGNDILAQRYDASGNRIDGNFVVNDVTDGSQAYSEVAVLADGRIAVTWTSNTSGAAGDGSGNGVFVRLFGDAATEAQSDDPVVSGLADVTLDEAALNAGYVQVFAPGSISVGDPDSTDFDGGRLLIHIVRDYEAAQQFRSPDNFDQDQMTFQGVGVSISGNTVSVDGVAIGTLLSDGQNGAGLEVALNGNATPERMETLLGSLQVQNLSDDPRDTRTVEVTVTDGDGGQSGHDTFVINITPEQDGVEAVGPETQVNSYTTNQQVDSAVAGLSGGGHVVVWSSYTQDNPGQSDWGVFAQLFDVDGQPVGPEFQVNTTFAGSQYTPTVTGLADGSFVVAWYGNGIGDTAGVFAQHVAADGTPVGTEFRLNDATGSTQSEPDIAASPSGGFIAVWRDSAGSDNVYARIYDATLTPIGVEFVVNTTTTGTQYEPAVAALSGGGYAVIWRDGNSGDVYQQVLDASGGLVGTETLVNTNNQTGTQYQPDIAALSNGGFVSVWRDNSGLDGSSNGVYAQTYDASGNATGDPFLVNEVVSSSQYEPVVTGLSTGGFVVAFRDDSGLDGSSSGVFAQQFDNGGNRIDGEFQVNTEYSSNQYQPAIAALQNGAFVISYTSNTSGTAGDGNSEGIFSQIFGDPADFNLEGRPVVQGVNATVQYLENTLNVGPQLLDANNAAAVSDSDSADFDGGFLRVDNVIVTRGYQDQIAPPDNYTQDNLGLRQAQGITISGGTVFVNGTAVGTITQDGVAGNPFEITLNGNADVAIVELLVENLTYRNTSDDPEPSRVVRLQVGDGDGGVSDPVLVTVNITEQIDGAAPVFGERQANTESAGNQEQSDVARLDDGGFVIVWRSYSQDVTNTWGVYGQRFDANGNAVDGEFLVNTGIAGNQYEPSVTGLDTGGWVVTWRDDSGLDGNGSGIFMQRYNADGTAAGGETQVNTYTNSTQYDPQVTVLANGDYVVTWTSYNNTLAGGSRYDIYGQVYQSDGTAIGSEFLINSEVENDQEYPAVTALENGGFAVAWTSETSGTAGDGSGRGVFYQVYGDSMASYAAIGTEVQANTYTDSTQYLPEIAGLADGGWVIVWESNAQDGSGYGIFAQQYDASGVAIGQEFRVNDQRISTQSYADVAALTNGGYVIVYADSNGTDGSGWGVYAQQYDASGNRIDGALQVNTEYSSTQYDPSVAALDDGGFVVSWTSATSGDAGDGSANGVFYQVFGNSAPVVTDVNATTPEDTALVFDAQLFADGFADAEGQLLAEIRIDVLPSIGTLEFNGSPVTPGQVVTVAQLDAGLLVYIPVADYNGTADFGWTGSDGNTFAATIAQTFIEVTPVNDPVGLAAISDQSIGEGSYLNINAALADPDNDTYTITVNYGEGDPDVVFNTGSKTPQLFNFYDSEGTYTVNLSVDDNNGSVESTSFDVTVTNAPPNADNEAFSTDEDTAISGVNVFVGDSDPGGDPFTITQIDGTAYTPGDSFVIASGATVSISATGDLIYDPTTSATLQALASGQNFTDSFTYRITDDGGLHDTATVTIYVSGADDNVVAQDDSFTVDEDSAVSGSVFGDNGNGPDIDPEGDTLTVVSVNGNVSYVGAPLVQSGGGVLTVNADGTISFVATGQYDELAVGATRDITFTYVVQESGSNLTASATGTVTITGVNDDPFANDDSVTTDIDTSTTISVLNGDYDVDSGDILTVTGVGTPANGTAVVNPDNTITYTPTLGYTGSDSFTYDISDGNGGTAMATVYVTVLGNSAPVALNDFVSTGASVPLSGDVFANNGGGADYDPESDPFSVTEVNGQAASLGTQITLPSGALLTLNANGTFDYDPNGAFVAIAQGANGSDSFTYTIEDSFGGTDTATVYVTVTGENDAPVMANGTGAANEDGAVVSIQLAPLGSDPDNDDNGNTLSYAIVAAPGEGSGSISGTALLFDPGTDFQDLAVGETRTVSFSVQATDRHGAVSNDGVIDVTVTGANDAPTLGAGTLAAVEDGPAVTLDLSALGGDIDSDDDGASLTYTIVGAPSEGSASISGTDLVFDPGADFQDLGTGETRDVVVQVQATDSHGALSSIEDVTVTVTGVNDAPQIVSGPSVAIDENTTAVTTVVATDAEGDPLSFAIVGGDDAGLFQIDPTLGTLSFIVAPDFENPGDIDMDNVYLVEVSVDDGTDSTTQMISVTVNDVDDTGPNVITGTSGIDLLIGTDGEDLIRSMGGPLDNLRGLGGADVFEFTNLAGVRDTMRVLDYETGVDSIDLGGESIFAVREFASYVALVLDTAEHDMVFVYGTGDVDDIDFV
ncbi:hypothetical protein RGUI_4318 (plasmid) [Rhodovulum sp. P5]|uniref:Ig-like domain-containing protein n=1 Tax=Rhodovulum sp. P5 TaxID=1564506 RepID=UPI0009C3DC46|nr:Ig-like domain-containing protein [Rhodovulum sp. P5]ARE42344.1 hypothetical protein RGUI_4318 [Rhodovulum sp. P5]